MYLKRDIAKFKLRRSTLTHTKRQYEEQIKTWENEECNIEKKIAYVHEQTNHFHTRSEIVIAKMGEIQQKIDKYSKQ